MTAAVGKATWRLDTVFVVSGVKEHAKMDRACLKELSPRRIEEFASGVEALRSWPFFRVDLAIVDSELSDMSGLDFIRRVGKNAAMRKTPVVVITADNRSRVVLDVVEAGCSGYVLRPYSLETFIRHVTRALTAGGELDGQRARLEAGRGHLAAGDYDKAAASFEEVFSEEHQARKYYDMGMRSLAAGNYGQAIAAFKRAVSLNDLYAEAYRGLAEAYKGNGRMEEYHIAIRKAASVFAEADRLEECKQIFIEILKYDAKTPNPFNSLGVTLRQRGDAAGALHAYHQALELTPTDEVVYYNIAKAAGQLGDKDKALRAVSQALELNPSFAEGRTYYTALTGAAWPVPAVPEATGKPSRGSLVDA